MTFPHFLIQFTTQNPPEGTRYRENGLVDIVVEQWSLLSTCLASLKRKKITWKWEFLSLSYGLSLLWPTRDHRKMRESDAISASSIAPFVSFLLMLFPICEPIVLVYFLVHLRYGCRYGIFVREEMKTHFFCFFVHTFSLSRQAKRNAKLRVHL